MIRYYFVLVYLLLLITSNESKRADVTIFYNVYLPEDANYALEIVEEQLGYRARSILPHAPVHYVTIGKDVGKLHNCTRCRRINHHAAGNEIVTLSRLYEYCTTHQDQKVAYIHNKGSFHKTSSNEKLRILLNKAVFSEECLSLQTPPPSASEPELSTCNCNICSARFSPIPYLYMSGNMWVSECSYISKLIHPSKFESEMAKMIRDAPIEKFGGMRSVKYYDTALGRFSAEHWIASHPDSCPCDVYPGNEYAHGRFNVPSLNTWVPQLSRAPRKSVFGSEVSKYGFQQDRANWFGTQGRIYEYLYLYQKIPDDDSWFWKFYPRDEMISTIQ